jgi:chromate transporter
MAIGFLAYAAFKAFKISINNLITKVIMLIALAVTFYFFKIPWVFPTLVMLGGIATNFSNKRIPQKEASTAQANQVAEYLWIFVLIFIVAGFLSETARTQQWPKKKSI